MAASGEELSPQRHAGTGARARGGPRLTKRRILFVDDEESLRLGVARALREAGYAVETAASGEMALKAIETALPELLLLDLMLPDMDGLEVCRAIRARSDLPILMLTARDDDVDRILGLEVGADDYLTKPFQMRELILRIGAILRRVGETYSGNRVSLDGGRVEIDYGRREVRVAGQAVALTPTEFALFAYLVRHGRQVLSRDRLLQEVWGYDFPGDLRTVDVHIRRLRRKLERDPAEPRLILTRFGIGYYADVGH
jgi:two-component system response regulator VicR